MTIVLRCDRAPPSANRAWRMFRGHMTRSSEFKAWEKLAKLQFSRANQSLPTACYWSTRIFVPVIKNRPDLDNMAKGIHDAIVRAGLAPDDRYLVKTTLEFWPGQYLIIHLKEEPLDKWQNVMQTSPTILRRMKKAKTSQRSPLLV